MSFISLFKSHFDIFVKKKKFLLKNKKTINLSINTIIKNHNINGILPKKFKDCYIMATAEPHQFFLIDMKNRTTHLRGNFLNFFQ